MEPSEAAALLKEVQATELIMLKEVAAFCDARGLRYYLYCGTLLGAVRHGGFIPWDDDVDLAMPYGDYRRFLASREELTGYTVESPETNPYAYTTWIRVYKDGTTFLDPAAVGTPVHKGVFLDIYPIIGARTSRLGRKWQSLCLRGAMSLLASGQFRNRTEMKHPLTRLAARLPEPMTRRMGHLLWKICGRDDTKREYVGTVDFSLPNIGALTGKRPSDSRLRMRSLQLRPSGTDSCGSCTATTGPFRRLSCAGTTLSGRGTG